MATSSKLRSNDAVAAGFNDSSFYRQGVVSLDPATVGAAACRSVEAQRLDALHDLHLAITVGGDSVRIEGQARVDAVFGRAVPGFGQRQVSSTADAALSRGTQAAPAELGSAIAVACD